MTDQPDIDWTRDPSAQDPAWNPITGLKPEGAPLPPFTGLGPILAATEAAEPAATARLTVTITARDAAHHARTIADHLTAEYGDSMRLDIHVDTTATEATGTHVYLSTGCLHGEHDYCAAMTGMQGEKRPGRCKWCPSECVCSCHGGSR